MPTTNPLCRLMECTLLFLKYYIIQHCFILLLFIWLWKEIRVSTNTTLKKYLPQIAHHPRLLELRHPSPQLHNEPVYSLFSHSPSPPELLPQLLLGGECVITVLFHKGNISRNDSLGTALHKLKHLLLGWRVKVIKKDSPNAPSLPTMGYVKVVVTPGKQSKAQSGIRGKQQRHERQCECFHLEHHPWLRPAVTSLFVHRSNLCLDSITYLPNTLGLLTTLACFFFSVSFTKCPIPPFSLPQISGTFPSVPNSSPALPMPSYIAKAIERQFSPGMKI